jgi:hypothetical protein
MELILHFDPGVDTAPITNEYNRHLWTDCLENVGALTSHNPMGLHGLLQG